MPITLAKRSIDVGIVTRDGPRLQAFYRDVFGMEPFEDLALLEQVREDARHLADHGAAELAPGGENGRGNVRQGMLESSNVNIVEELVEMIECQRAYEISSKMVSAVDEMLRNANQTL